MNLNEFLTGIGFTAKYPYTDIHELNLDWLLAQIATLRVEFDDFAHVNSLKYAGEWNITKSYSAFSVVDDQGFGYMALKPVPPGTQINDTEYWLMVVDYSQITQDYENRISALETTVGDASSGLVKDVDDLQTDVSNAQGDITALQGTVGDASSGLVKDVGDLQTTVGDASSGLVKDVGDLQTTVGDASIGLVKDVDDLETVVGDNSSGLVKDVNDLETVVGDNSSGLVKDVNDLKAATTVILPLSNRKIIMISDSYGTTVNGVTSFADIIGTTYIDSDSIYENYSIGSLGIVPNANAPGVKAHLEDLITNNVIAHPETVTDLVIALGANDIARYNQLDTYFEPMVDYIKQEFKIARVHIGFIGTTWANTIADRIATIEKYKTLSATYNLTYMENLEYIMCTGANLQGDRVHPNSTGANKLAEGVALAVKNGVYDYSQTVSTTVTISGNSITLNFTFKNGIVIVSCEQGNISSFTLGASFTAGTYSGDPPIRGNGSFGFTTMICKAAQGFNAMQFLFNNNNPYARIVNDSVSGIAGAVANMYGTGELIKIS